MDIASKIIQKRANENKKISFIWDSVVTEILGTPVVNSIKIKNVKTGETSDFKTDGVFIFIGYIPNNSFIPDAISRDSLGFVITNEKMETTIPGIYAAGDIRSKLLKQVITACSDGATAVYAAEKYIEWNFHK